VGGVSQETTDAEFREYFSQFGRVIDSTLMMDKDTGRPRGFGFVTFESEVGVENCLNAELAIHGKPIEVKKAQPRGNMREEEEANRRAGNKFGRKGVANGIGEQEASSQQMSGGAGGMTPQVMAQYWQRMQQYFAMMQQQMAVSRGMGMGGMNMNPAMMQMMQMQHVQQMQQMMAAQGRGGGNPMANMTPQMMQQMQQMQQMMAQNQAQQQIQGGRGNQGFNNAMEQQMFEEQSQQQQPAPPQAPQGPAGNRRRDQQQQQQQFQQGGYGMGGGAPTSWEGMYDDVPQPNFNQGGGRGGFNRNRGGHQQQQQQPGDPMNAPPANAPTGPKNAGKPGANYRGGGRGGSRGFHPYARG
jgi:RNA-binding protein Musashi